SAVVVGATSPTPWWATAVEATSTTTVKATAAAGTAAWATGTSPVAVAAAAWASSAGEGAAPRAAVGLQLGCRRHLATQRRLAGEIDTTLRIHLNHHHRDLVAWRDHILRSIDWIVGQLRRAHQTLLAWQNLDEGAKVYDAANRARIDLADLHLLG